jgi:hypothetical protein
MIFMLDDIENELVVEWYTKNKGICIEIAFDPLFT